MTSAISDRPVRNAANDRRRHCRYGFLTSLRYRSAGESIGVWKDGRSLNMSASGILIGSDEVLPTGARVELMVDWPGFLHGEPRMRLAVFGQVVRCQESGIAIRILRHDFRTVAAAVRVARA